MKILFLDQSGRVGGAELCLLDVAACCRDRSLVALFEDGTFRQLLEDSHIPVQVLSQTPISVRKESSWLAGVKSVRQLLPLSARVVRLSRQYDAIYANTQKALVVGAIASFLSRRPLIYHLHDILSLEHFSLTNQRLAVTLANRAALVIANSEASKAAFLEAGGQREKVYVVYNGFQLSQYQENRDRAKSLRFTLGLEGKFVIGHFSRLSPWKGQHVLLDALSRCSADVTAIFVGDALFGEQAYVQQLHEQVERLELGDRVQFLGFRSDVIPLMQMCDIVTHTSTAAEPFGRVIVEAMLCGTPVIAAKAGGALELVEPERTGWLVEPGDPQMLADAIAGCQQNHTQANAIAQYAQSEARRRFDLETINQQSTALLKSKVFSSSYE
ncbi:glycosyltransferase [Myxacorys almedinensis]|uniref:Glycosyltransferase n=1 Tax=Myxacorys almedinensis A TaxID=2690445 RepID=A0A8J8CHK2_9CYAN|nr:glycosyltransferase [Myxacorys almedinensis A]